MKSDLPVHEYLACNNSLTRVLSVKWLAWNITLWVCVILWKIKLLRLDISIRHRDKHKSVFFHSLRHEKVRTNRTSGFYPSTFVYSCFPPRFSFITVCLVQWLHGVPHGRHCRKKFLEFRSADCCKMHFSYIFLVILEFYREF